MLLTGKQPWPQSHHELIEHYYAQYAAQIASGEFQPYLYPWGTLGAVGVIVYLMIPHRNRPWLKKCRYLAFAWMCGFAVYTVAYTRARGMAPALGIGLINAWGATYAAAILVTNDAQEDFMRIERTEGFFRSSKPQAVGTGENKSNGHMNGHQKEEQKEKNSTSDIIANGHAGPSERHGSFAWQPFPISPLNERLDWVCDLFCNFRGAGWNWRTSAIPPPPKWVQEQLRRNSGSAAPKHSFRVHSGQVTVYTTRKELLVKNAKTLFIGYMMLDALKTAMMHDPYFWGIMDRPPPTYLPTFISQSPVVLHAFRMFLCMLGIKYALQTIFSSAPLLFSGLLGPDLIGARAEPWIFPETWASYSTVLDRGLAGWWSCWWHQTFRFAFEQPSKKIIEKLGIDRKSAPAKIIQLLVAFGLSGVLHASGSHTAAGETSPLGNVMVFFLLQAIGVFAEVVVTQVVRAMGIQRYAPKWSVKAFTFVYVHVWFYFTAHLLCDDFSRGGVWLFEPVPVSLFRGLGLGADKRDGWWCWSGRVVRWHHGDRWWRSGLAF